jgi:hypothetical protein
MEFVSYYTPFCSALCASSREYLSDVRRSRVDELHDALALAIGTRLDDQIRLEQLGQTRSFDHRHPNSVDVHWLAPTLESAAFGARATLAPELGHERATV